MICPFCTATLDIALEYTEVPLDVIVASVCCRCNAIFRLAGSVTRALSDWEERILRASASWPALLTLQLRNSCLKKLETAGFN